MKRRVTRGGASKQKRLRAVQNAYAYKLKKPQRNDPGLVPLAQSDMASAFLDPDTNDIVVGVRGTVDMKDWVRANALIPFGQLKRSPQYQATLNFIKEVQSKYPGHRIELSGHSLGGAIATEMQRELGADAVPMVETYNQALQPQDHRQGRTEGVHRVYHKADPLRFIFKGQNVEDEVRDGEEYGLGAHALDQFESNGQ
jgi:hypothetical protein